MSLFVAPRDSKWAGTTQGSHAGLLASRTQSGNAQAQAEHLHLVQYRAIQYAFSGIICGQCGTCSGMMAVQETFGQASVVGANSSWAQSLRSKPPCFHQIVRDHSLHCLCRFVHPHLTTAARSCEKYRLVHIAASGPRKEFPLPMQSRQCSVRLNMRRQCVLELGGHRAQPAVHTRRKLLPVCEQKRAGRGNSLVRSPSAEPSLPSRARMQAHFYLAVCQRCTVTGGLCAAYCKHAP
jgi:hypothetical protein